jgi:HEPN domain-containing protein
VLVVYGEARTRRGQYVKIPYVFTEEIKKAMIFLATADRHANEKHYGWAASHWSTAAGSYLLSGKASDPPHDASQIRGNVANALMRVYEKIERLQNDFPAARTSETIQESAPCLTREIPGFLP